MNLLNVNGYDLALVEQGAGIPLVLVHGSLLDLRFWVHQMEPFSRHYRAIAVSMRHFWPERWDGSGGSFTIQQHVDDTAAFLGKLEAGPVHLVGHSRGGHIAFRVAQHHPHLIRSLVLAEPGGSLDATLRSEQALGASPLATIYADTAARIRAGDVEDGLSSMVDAISGPGTWDRTSASTKGHMRDNAR